MAKALLISVGKGERKCDTRSKSAIVTATRQLNVVAGTIVNYGLQLTLKG